MANLKLIDDMGLVDNAAEVGAYLQAQLREAPSGHPRVAEIRSVGVLAAIEFAEDPAARKIGLALAANLLAEGVIARAMPQGDILGNYIHDGFSGILVLTGLLGHGTSGASQKGGSPADLRHGFARQCCAVDGPQCGNMTRRPGLACLHGEERWRWPLR